MQSVPESYYEAAMIDGASPMRIFFRVIFPLLLTGLGAGISFMPLLTIAMADVPPRDAGLAWEMAGPGRD